MRYPATIIQSEFQNFVIFCRPAAKGWDVILATQIAEKYRHEGATSCRWIFTVDRKREIAKKMQEAIDAALDSLQKALIACGATEGECEVSIGQGFVDDDEMAH